MATRYLRSTDGSDGDDGSTWALAKASLSGVAAIDTAGDTIWISQAHAENAATQQTCAFAGTVAAPTMLWCGNDAAEPPTALADTATITNTYTGAGNGITITGNVQCWGVTFSCSAYLYFGSTSAADRQIYDNCSLRITGAGSGGAIFQAGPSTAGGADLLLRNCTISMNASGNFIQSSGRMRIDGGSMLAGTATSTGGLFRPGTAGRGALLLVENFDFSNCASTLVLVQAVNGSGQAVFRHVKMPNSWAATNLVSAAPTSSVRVSLYDYQAAAPYSFRIDDLGGTITHETTVVMTDGASDGTTALAWKMVTTASANYPVTALMSDEIVAWVDTTGTSKTATIEIIHDSVTALTDAEVWVELMYRGTAGSAQGTRVADVKADLLTTPASQDSSSATWADGTLTNPNKQKLVVTFTPEYKGPVVAKVYLAKASKTIYVNPLLTIT